MQLHHCLWKFLLITSFPSSRERNLLPNYKVYVLTARKTQLHNWKVGSWEEDNIRGHWQRSQMRRPSHSLSSGDKTSLHIRLHWCHTRSQTEFYQPESQAEQCRLVIRTSNTSHQHRDEGRVFTEHLHFLPCAPPLYPNPRFGFPTTWIPGHPYVLAIKRYI